MIEETLRIQAIRNKEDVEDLEDFDLQLVFYPNLFDAGPHIIFYAVNDELFVLSLEDFMKLTARARIIWGPLQDSGGSEQ